MKLEESYKNPDCQSCEGLLTAMAGHVARMTLDQTTRKVLEEINICSQKCEKTPIDSKFSPMVERKANKYFFPGRDAKIMILTTLD